MCSITVRVHLNFIRIPRFINIMDVVIDLGRVLALGDLFSCTSLLIMPIHNRTKKTGSLLADSIHHVFNTASIA